MFKGNENANLTSAGKRGRATPSEEEEEDKDVEESCDDEHSSRATKRSSARLLRKRKA